MGSALGGHVFIEISGSEVTNSELNITGRLPEAGNLKPNCLKLY